MCQEILEGLNLCLYFHKKLQNHEIIKYFRGNLHVPIMGQITQDQFLWSCSDFVTLSDAAGDNWEIVKDGTNAWIQRTAVINVTKHSDDSADIDEDILGVDKTIDDDDSNTLEVKAITTEQISCTYEVHYSPSYSVPVLYCRFWTCSGQMLSLEQVWSLAPLPARGWDRLSMAPHPVTGMPWVQVHPCQTGQMADLMISSSNSSKCNYIVTFLSLYGQAVGLTISTKYVQII